MASSAAATVKYEATSTTFVSATAVMPTSSICFASPRFSDHLIAAISPPSGRGPAGRIWSKLPASHWASTPSNDSVYETHCSAKPECPSADQSFAGNCRCQRPLSWPEHGSSHDAFASSSGNTDRIGVAIHDVRLRRQINFAGMMGLVRALPSQRATRLMMATAVQATVV